MRGSEGPDEPENRSWIVGRALIAGVACATGVCAALLAGLPPLDVALWAVLTPLVATALLELAPRARRPAAVVRGTPPVVVLPERSVAQSGQADPAVRARETAVDHARATLLEARQCGADMDDLLALSETLHEATLDLARALESAGSAVPQALHDQLALRGRPEPAEPSPSQPVTY